MRPKMNLTVLNTAFDTDAECRQALEELRWPNGVRCLRCDSEKTSRISTRHQYDCDSCRYRFSVTTGTVFHDSHLPLPKWFLAVLLMCEAKNHEAVNHSVEEWVRGATNMRLTRPTTNETPLPFGVRYAPNGPCVKSDRSGNTQSVDELDREVSCRETCLR